MNATAIHIRTARAEDWIDLWRLAALDSATIPAEPMVVAESESEIVAAVSLQTGDAIADPFRRTSEALELLRLRAAQLPRHARTESRGGLLRRLRGRPAPAAAQ